MMAPRGMGGFGGGQRPEDGFGGRGRPDVPEGETFPDGEMPTIPEGMRFPGGQIPEGGFGGIQPGNSGEAAQLFYMQDKVNFFSGLTAYTAE